LRAGATKTFSKALGEKSFKANCFHQQEGELLNQTWLEGTIQFLFFMPVFAAQKGLPPWVLVEEPTVRKVNVVRAGKNQPRLAGSKG